VTKPFDARELLLRVASHLRLARRVARLPERGPAPEPGPTDPTAALPDRPLAILLRARDHLLANMADPPDLAALARHCATNRTSLERLFKTHLGMSVFGYLREQRLQRARRLLEQGRYSVGYRSGRNLARAFKQRFGIAPGGWSRAG